MTRSRCLGPLTITGRPPIVALGCVLLLAVASAPTVPPTTSASTMPALKDEAAWAELERRGEKASLLAALDAARYDARPAQDAAMVELNNPAQALHATYSPEGVRLLAGTAELQLRPVGIGFGDALQPITHVATRTAGARVEIERTSTVTEWWINRASGLEQGYTVGQAPAGRADDQWLRVVTALDGDLTLQVAADGQSATFTAGDGITRLHYDHLQVRDAAGRPLAARMRAGLALLSIEIDDAHAVYPVTIDPTFSAPTYLKASNTDEGDYFGYSVAVSGDTVVVGARWEDGSGTGVNPVSNNSANAAGAAYVFVRNGTTWSQQAYLKAHNTGAADLFGYAVAISGDTVVVGAVLEDGSGTGVDPASNNNAIDAGAAYVFVRSGTTWSQQAYLKAHNTEAADYFGDVVAVSGDTVVVGARQEDGSGTGVNPASNNNAASAGAAYVFVRNGTTWSHQAYLKASNSGFDDQFGNRVAVSGDTVVVGATTEDGSGTGVNPASDDNAPDSGAAYVFVRDGTTWSQQAYLKAHNTGAGDLFGYGVGVSGDTVVVGAEWEDGSGTGVNPVSDNTAEDAGAAYVFVRNGTTWSQQAYLKAPNTSFADEFGSTVAVSGDTVVVGATDEDGSGTGVDPASDDSAPDSGAAYVFVRSGTTWNQQAYLKASNTDPVDSFGWAVAVSGDTVVVGAIWEDSPGTGVNPVSGNGALDAGAAYVYSVAPPPPPLVDLNGDGSGDAFLYDSATGGWSRQISLTGGGFSTQSEGAWIPGWTVLSAHFNTDALTDFFLYNATTGEWYKLLNDGSGFTTQSTGAWWPGWQKFVMDLDGDGISDLFLYDPVTGHWYKCFSTPTGFDYAPGGWRPGWEITVIDLNGDAFTDLFLIDRATGQWFWVLGQDSGEFTYPLTSYWVPDWALYPGDFNGDGLGDLFLYRADAGEHYVALNNGTGFTYTAGYGWAAGWSPYIGDFDGDGSDDLFLYNASTGQWFEFISDNAGGFTQGGDQWWTTGWQLYPTDLNGDGRTDILLYDPTTGWWYQARNLVTGTFSYSSGVWAPGLTIITGTPIR